MLFVVLIIGFLTLLLLAAAWIDWKARRRGVRYTGVDSAAARDTRRFNEAELHMRGNQVRDGGGGSLPF